MSSPKTMRLLTTLAVIGICGWPVWKGSEVIRYAMAGSTVEVQPWLGVSGLAFAAREDALTPVTDSSDDTTIRKRRDEIAELLAISPLSARYWVKLAEARVDAQEAPAKALDALELSAVTGPNEGYLITQRGLFGIWQWETLPAEAREQTIKDLVARQVSDAKLAWLRTTLAQKPERVREEIRLGLQAHGFSKSNFARIGM